MQGTYCAAVPADEETAELLDDCEGAEKDDAQMRRVARLVMLTHMEPTPKTKAMEIDDPREIWKAVQPTTGPARRIRRETELAAVSQGSKQLGRYISDVKARGPP